MKTNILKMLTLTIAVMLLLPIIASCGDVPNALHKHIWIEATCTSPKTCSECQATVGEPKGHSYTVKFKTLTCTTDGDATYTCACGDTYDAFTTAPGHNWQTDEDTGIVLCTNDGCIEIEGSEIKQDKNLTLLLSRLPIATSDMTEDELRDIVVQFMNIQINFAYQANLKGYGEEYGYLIKNLSGSYDAHVNINNIKIKFENGKYYGGIPYMGNAAGSLYRWLPFYDAQTGVMDWSPIIASQRLNWVDEDTGVEYSNVGSALFGNSCSASCIWAWSRVTNEINTFWTAGWIPANGFVKVGEYDLSPTGTHGGSTSSLCKKNGEQTMYKAYAQTLRADGLVQSGHAVMIITDPVVVYNKDGSINGDKSYLCIAEQKASFLTASPMQGGKPLYSPMNDNGVTYRVMGNYPGNVVNEDVRYMRWSFKTLYSKGMLPFTVPELAGTAPVDKAVAKLSHSSSTITVEELASAVATSNYMISDVTFIVTDAEGAVQFRAYFGNLTDDPYQMKTRYMSDALTNNRMYTERTFIGERLPKFADGNHTLEILCRLSTGELISVYKGTLTE